jgi:predicted ester cyclase
METSNQVLITSFIERIWNQSDFACLDTFLHPQFKDHSLPAGMPKDVNGLKQWIIGTGKSFEHKTVVEDLITERNKCVVKIRMDLKHIGIWRGIEPEGKTVSVVGFRLFRIIDGRIIEHWALVDGQAIENQMQSAAHGCKIAM